MHSETKAEWGPDGWAVSAGEGELIELGGPHRPEILVRGGDVEGALGSFVFHHGVISENQPHAHQNFMKIAYVLEGEYHFRVGGAEFTGGPGTVVVVPRASYHTFVTPTGGKLLFVCAPAAQASINNTRAPNKTFQIHQNCIHTPCSPANLHRASSPSH